MSKNIFKTLLVSFIVLFSAIFINIDGVKAAEVIAESDGSGYAKCYYTFSEQQIQTSVGETSVTYDYGMNYYIGIAFYKINNNDDGYRSWAEIGCNDSATNNKKTMAGRCSFTNYNDVFHQAKNYKKYFNNGSSSKPTWKCPTYIWLDKEELKSTMSIFFDKKQCENSHFGATCKQAGRVKYDIKGTGKIDNDLSYIYGQNAGYVTSDDPYTNDYNGSESTNENDITKILNWGKIAQEGEYTSADVGSNCNKISEVAELLNTILWIVDIIAIIILIIMTAVDLVRAIIGSEEDTLKSAFKHLIIRIIVVFILLLLPILLGTIISIINTEAGTVQIGDDGKPFCDVGN